MLSRDGTHEARDIVRIERTRGAMRPLGETAAVVPVRTRADLQDARDRHARWAAISSALYATGLAASGVAVYFIYKGARQRRDLPPPLAVAPIGAGAMVPKELAW